MSGISKGLLEKARKIKMLIMDVDGTLTDGKIFLGNNGEEMKAFSVKDGLGIQLLHQSGVIPVIITGRESNIVRIRARELNIKELYQGIKDKLGVYEGLKEKYGFLDEEIGFVGDDLNDLPILEKAGVSFTVNDGVEVIKGICDYCSNKNGGDGAVREIIDLILYAKTSEKGS
ncbi:MAG: HAD hydrolase family protein [Halanaerobiaceae bacterium]|nr:HAD hydrolase family protein [Halanaerobiaceae bacterium]